MSNTNAPHVICHMMSTIDGKITSADATDILSENYFDLYTKTEDMLGEVQGYLLGRVTMQMFASKEQSVLPSSSGSVEHENYYAPHNATQFLFGVDTKGVLRWDRNQIEFSNVAIPLHLVIVVTQETPKEYLSYLKDKEISYMVAGQKEIDFKSLFGVMKEKFGVSTLLVEGGGILNGSVLQDDLIDEISLLITPTVVNQKDAPALFERKEDQTLNLKTFSLASVEKLDKDTLWIRYTRTTV